MLMLIFPVVTYAESKPVESKAKVEDSTQMAIIGAGTSRMTISRGREKESLAFSIAGVNFELSGKDDKKQKGRRYRSRIGVFTDLRFGYVMLSSPDYSMYGDGVGDFLNLNIAKSYAFAFSPLKLKLLLNNNGRHWASTGLHFSWANYTLSNDLTVTDSYGVLMPVPLDSSISKSKMVVTTMSVPIGYRYTSRSNFSVEVAVSADVNLGLRTKYKDPKVKSDKMWIVNPIGASTCVTIAYKKIGVYAKTSLTPMFDSSTGPETRATSIGLQFSM